MPLHVGPRCLEPPLLILRPSIVDARPGAGDDAAVPLPTSRDKKCLYSHCHYFYYCLLLPTTAYYYFYYCLILPTTPYHYFY